MTEQDTRMVETLHDTANHDPNRFCRLARQWAYQTNRTEEQVIEFYNKWLGIEYEGLDEENGHGF